MRFGDPYLGVVRAVGGDLGEAGRGKDGFLAKLDRSPHGRKQHGHVFFGDVTLFKENTPFGRPDQFVRRWVCPTPDSLGFHLVAGRGNNESSSADHV